MTDAEGVGEFSHEGLVHDFGQLRRQNEEMQARLEYLGMRVPENRMLLVRLNLLIESAFGPIDYDDLDSADTSTERLVYEHAFQRARRNLLSTALAQAEAAQSGLATPPDKRLILPDDPPRRG